MKSNRRFILNLLLIAAVAGTLCACDDSDGSGGADTLCEQSGGTYHHEDGKCECKDKLCPAGVVCNVESKECASAEVSPIEDLSCRADGETICLDGDYRTCKDGKWGELTPCSTDPDRRILCADNKCGECVEDESKCEGGERKQCVHGKWTKMETCEYGCADGYSCASKCDENKCVNENEHGKMAECKDNRTVSYTCENKETSEPVSCNAAGSGCGICLNGNIECNDGKTTKCMNGKWDEPTACPDNFSCKSATECGECQDGKSKECKDSQLTACSGGIWTTAPCPNESSCKSAAECGECQNGTKKCEDGKVAECQNGMWGAVVACPDNFSCKSAAECGECQDGAKKCEDGQAAVCQKGSWSDATACPNNASCNSSNECGECKTGEKQCETKAGVHNLSTCVDGAWAQSPCPDSTFCNSSVAADKCVSCTKGKCKDNAFIPCINGEWGTPQDCEKEKKVCFAQPDKLGCFQ